MAKRCTIFVETPFAKSDIQLGRLVPSRSRPDIDAVSPITVSEADTSRKEDGNFADSWNSSSSAAFTAMLTKLFSLSLKSDASVKIELRALPGTDGLLPDGNADVAVEGKYEKTTDKGTKFVALRERVFAVGCRRARIGQWNKKDVTLEDKIFWKSAFNRGESAEVFHCGRLRR